MEREKSKDNNGIEECFRKQLDSIQKKAEEEYERLMREMRKSKKEAEEYIESNPKKAMGISMGIGVLVGITLASLMIKRR